MTKFAEETPYERGLRESQRRDKATEGLFDYK